MELPKANFQPFSVERGVREPFRLVEGVPEHSKELIDDWIRQTVYGSSEDEKRVVMMMANMLRVKPTKYLQELINRVSMNDDDYLDLLQLLLGSGLTDHGSLDLIFEQGGSIWRVADSWDRLEQRVSVEARESYAKALDVHDRGAAHLSEAWRHAFGLKPDPKDAWHDAVRAVEAVLHPIVSPKDGSAQLTKMLGDIRNAPEGRFIFRTPGEPAREAFLNMVSAVPYEEGRHGSDPRTATLETARVVVLQATAVIAAIGEGAIERA